MEKYDPNIQKSCGNAALTVCLGLGTTQLEMSQLPVKKYPGLLQRSWLEIVQRLSEIKIFIGVTLTKC